MVIPTTTSSAPVHGFQCNFRGWRSKTCRGGIGSWWPRFAITLCIYFLPHVNVWTGILTALTQPSPDALRIAIRETRKLTSKPFGVNITILPSIDPLDYQGYARAAVDEGVRIFETAGDNRLFSASRKQVIVTNVLLDLNS
jgi:hypothetical protein